MCFSSPPVEVNLLPGLSTRKKKKKTTASTALVSFRASQTSYVWRALTAQLKTILTDSTQSSNQSSEWSQANPQAHTSGAWGETKQGIGKERAPHSCGLEIGCFTISLSLSLSLYNYINNDLIAPFRSSTTLLSSFHFSSLDAICHIQASTHSVHRLCLSSFFRLFFFFQRRKKKRPRGLDLIVLVPITRTVLSSLCS